MPEWKDYSLDDVATIQIGGTPSRAVITYWASEFENGFPWVSIADLSCRIIEGTKERITEKGVINSNVKAVPAGTLIMSFKLSIGRTALAGVDLYTNEAIAAIVAKDRRVNPELLYYVLPLSAKSAITDTAVKGSTLNKSSLGKLRVKVPNDYAQQHKIANILQTIDLAIEKTEALIEKYQQIKAGLMHDLFTRGIGADGKLRPPREQAPELYQETPIGWIPREWNPRKLKEILATTGGYLQTGPFGSQLHAHEYTQEGVPLVMPQDINEGVIEDDRISRITESRARSLLKHRLRKGDIIIARRGELGRAASMEESQTGWVCGTGCFLLRLGGTPLDSRFIAMVYRHPMVQRQLGGLAVGTTMPSLNNEIMGELIFPSMNIDEQNAIVSIIETSQNKIVSMRIELEKLKIEKAGLMNDLLTGKVPVKVDPPMAAHV